MKKVSPQDVEHALELIQKNRATEEYFFANLRSPVWLDPLRKKGIFKRPQPKEQEAQWVRFPFWPAAKYLIQVASAEPEMVIDIILEADETDNIRVHEDFLEAALRAPASSARRIVPHASKWLKSSFGSLLPEKIAKLVAKLAEAHMAADALSLASAVLKLRPFHETSGAVTGEDARYRPPPEAIGFIEEYDYSKVLSICLTPLLNCSPVQTFEMLCRLLETGLYISLRKDELSFVQDFSYIWRISIGDEENNYSQPFLNLLISSLRDASTAIAGVNQKEFQEVVRSLYDRKWPIFKRIALYLIAKFPDILGVLPTECVTNRELFDSLSVRHEYYILIQMRFGKLNQVEKDIVLGWIEKGPDTEWYTKRMTELNGAPPTIESIEEYKETWQLERLEAIKDDLDPTWKERYDHLIETRGKPHTPDYPFEHSAVWIGPTSPKTVEDLSSMSVEDVANFLRSWISSTDPRSSSPEGLGRMLEAAVEQNPSRYAASAHLFADLDPTYVRQILSGLAAAFQKGVTFPLGRVLELFTAILSRPRGIEGRAPRIGDADPDWGWTRKSMAELIGNAISGGNPIDIEHRHKVWGIITILATDPEPDVAYEAQYHGSNMDPSTMSINTVRGEAFHTLVKYARWRKISIVNSTGVSTEKVTLEEFPEVKDLLERHLDLKVEPTLTVRSVYGQWFPTLVWLDLEWAKSHSNQIMPLSEELKPWFDAAWNAFICYSRPVNELLEILRPQYKYAISQLWNVSDEKVGLIRESPRHLIEHLMLFYGWSRLELSDELLQSFYKTATGTLRAHSLVFVGRSLRETPGVIPGSILERFMNLFEWRLSAISAESVLENAELAGIGEWIVSKKFDVKWWLPMLRNVLTRTKRVEWDNEVVKILAEVARENLREVVECLELMIHGEKDSWSGLMWRDSIVLILSAGLKSSDPAIARSCTELVHYLGAKGYQDFRALLS